MASLRAIDCYAKEARDFLAVAFAVGAVGTAIFIFRKADQAHVNKPHQAKDDFSAMLDALVVPFPEGRLSESQRDALAKRRVAQQEAVERLRKLGTNALPRLMEEVYAVGRIEATNRNAAGERTQRLARAFEILGGDASPLLPLLIEELHAGRSIGPSMAGIVYIGSTDAGLALLPGLTNSDPEIRRWTMSALSYFATNREVALAALHPLLRLLKDDSEFSRALAASVLGSLQQEPDAVIPDLLQVAKNDSDFVVRVFAVKAIGRFGTNAAIVKKDLEGIAATDQERRVRRIAEVAIRAANGEIPPDKVQ
jgi:hypothetical protein